MESVSSTVTVTDIYIVHRLMDYAIKHVFIFRYKHSSFLQAQPTHNNIQSESVYML